MSCSTSDCMDFAVGALQQALVRSQDGIAGMRTTCSSSYFSVHHTSQQCMFSDMQTQQPQIACYAATGTPIGLYMTES